MNFYKHHIGDYATDTPSLSLLEHGVYLKLLHRYYLTERPFPDDKKECARLIVARSRWEVQAVDRILSFYFPVASDGKRHNKRADEEIQQYQAQCVTNRKNVAKRFAKDSHPVRLPNQYHEPEPLTTNTTTSTIEPSTPVDNSDPFDEIESQNHDEYPEVNATLLPKKGNGNGKWWISHEGIDSEGRKYGLMARSGEDYPTYKSRIFDEIAKRKRMSQ